MPTNSKKSLRAIAGLCALCAMLPLYSTNAYAMNSYALNTLYKQKNIPSSFSPLTLPTPEKPVSPLNYQAVQPNEAGQILVLMYHGLDAVTSSAPYMTTVAAFKNDLQMLYDNGFRLITISDLINNEIKVKAGYTPVVLTFDDGMSTAFSLEEQDGKLVPAKDCAVDIINKFAESNPDFGKTAVFFINGSGRPAFQGAGTLADRFNYLIDNGYELGNHTFSHASMDKLNASQIQAEMAKLEKLVTDNVPGYKMQAMAFPYGVRPKEGLREYALKGEYEGAAYDYKLALRAGPVGTSATPNNNNFEPDNMPRIRGTDIDPQDLGWYIREFKARPELKYVSDGNPYVITVPASHTQKLDTSSFLKRLLNVYESTP